VSDATELHWSDDQAARIVRETYGAVVPVDTGVAQSLYSAEELAPLPKPVAQMALGLGNPVRYAGLRHGETVLDLGSGGRLVFSDSVIDGSLPKEVLENEAAYAG